MTFMRIALLEDDPSQLVHLATTLEMQLSERGLPVRCVMFQSGRALLEATRTDTFDLMVLDWSVPDLDGLALLRLVRRTGGLTMPVLMLSSRGREQEVSAALAEGADDYVVKPFRPHELSARVYRLLAPFRTGEKEGLQWGRWKFNVGAASVQYAGAPEPIELRPSESRLALALFRHSGRAVSRDYLLQVCGLADDLAGLRALETRIYRLRQKLGLNQKSDTRIQAVYGIGYRLDVDDFTVTAAP
jgi:DNA-binding response OmpR family regulator